MYDLNEKKLVAKKSNNEFLTKNLFENENQTKKNDDQKINEKSFINEFSTQQKIIKFIKTTYFYNVILQKFMKIKILNRRKVLVNITKAKMKLKFD